MNTAIILNAAAGTLRRMSVPAAVATVRERFAAAGHNVWVEALPPDLVARAIRRAAGTPEVAAVVVGGGDGTISTAVNLLAGTGKLLGVLPLGTMNLFARDLGLPLDLEGAAEVLARGGRRAIDCGEINGRLFVNHASLGLHPWMIRLREHQREQHGWGKWPAMAVALLRALRRYHGIELEILCRGETRCVRTPVVIVSNNRLTDGLGPIPGHERLDAGELAIYIGRSTGRLGFLRLVIAAALGRWNANAMLDSFAAAEVVLHSRRRRVYVSIDGELERLRPPLRCRCRRQALEVLAPEPGT